MLRKVEEFFYPEVPSIPVDVMFERSVSGFCSSYRAVSEYKPINQSSVESELLKFCERENILVYKIAFNEGLINYGRNRPFAVIGIGLSAFGMNERWKSEVILAHEIGHFLDYKLNFNFSGDKMAEYGSLRMELVAWDFAFRLLQYLGFDEWEKLMGYANFCLSGYFEKSFPEGFDQEEAIKNLFKRHEKYTKTNKFEMA